MREMSFVLLILGLGSFGCSSGQPQNHSQPVERVSTSKVAPIRTWERQELREAEQRKAFSTLIETEAGHRRDERKLYGLLSSLSKRSVEADAVADSGIDGWSLNKVAVQYHITEKDVSTIAAAGFKLRWTVREPQSQIRRDDYESLEDGMSYVEVLNVLDTPGEQLSRSNIGGTVTTMYKWSNVDLSNVNATFQNGRLVSKAQAGLR